MSGNERCNMYKETQLSIKKLLDKGQHLEKVVYMNQIVLIKNDILSNDENVAKTAIEMLRFLSSLNIEEVDVELIKLIHDDTISKLIQNCVLKSIKQKVVDSILENNFVNILSPWKNQNINKLTNIVEDVCVSDLPKEKCKDFFINTIIPTMMEKNTNDQIRDSLIDIAFVMSTILPISDLTADELQLFLKEVNTKYVVNIAKLRVKDYSNWHNLWIFLVRFCDKHIHSSMELTNNLLRVVEDAFRISSAQPRLKGYDCWKELIDNASLDMRHMCSAKQIKLLITPLKAKFSKQEVVISKRFDVFTYLLEKLQHKAVLCLVEFLEFCFGAVGDNKDITKTGQVKIVPQILNKSVKVLLEIIGHSHNKTVLCLSTDDVIKLEKPVINYTNIYSYYKVIINSVAECCILLKDVDIESKREMVLKCFWKSIFYLIIPTSEEHRKKYFQLISEILNRYMKQSLENPYFEDLLILIFSVLMSYDSDFVYEVIEYILKELLTIIFITDDFPLTVADKFKGVLSHYFSKMVMVENKLRTLREIMVAYMKLKPSAENIIHAGNIWLCVANELIGGITVEQIEGFNEFHSFFMWPTYYLHHLEESIKKQTILHWMKIYRKITAECESKKLKVMKDLQKIFKSNPLLNSSVVSFLNIMSQFEAKFTTEFVNHMMIVLSQILQLPNLKTEEEQKITAVVMQYFEPSLYCYKDDSSDELIKSICTCIEHILCIHKCYKILDTLSMFMRNSSSALKQTFSKHLSSFLLDLYNKETDLNSYSAKELQKVLQVLNAENINKDDPISFKPPGGRSARIAHLAKSSPRSPQRRGRNVTPSPTALRLFGKDLDTLSPLHVKGSQLCNVTTPKSKKKSKTAKSSPSNLRLINEEKSSDFVPIDTEVKLQPEKMSKHQKEMLKKRREDIPALYQDLSQSQSHDMFSSLSSKGFDKTEKEESVDNRKVIVEIIEEQFKANSFTTEENVQTSINTPSEYSSSTATLPPGSKNIFSDTDLRSPAEPVQDTEKLNLPTIDVKFETNLPDTMQDTKALPEAGIDVTNEVTVLSKETDTSKNILLHEVRNHITTNLQEVVNDDVGDKSYEIETKSKHTNLKIEYDETLTNEIFKQSVEKSIHVEGDNKESVKAEPEEKRRRGKQRIESELQKLKMDIVDAEKFLTASRRTRTREKTKKLEDTSYKKGKTVLKEEKVTSPKQEMSRKSLSTESLNSKEFLSEKNRRKTIGAVSGINIPDTSKILSPNKKFNKPVECETSTTRKSSEKLKDCKMETNVTSPKELTIEKTFRRRGKSKKRLCKDELVESKETQRGEKRKHCEEESEDIIESSQEFHAVLTPVFNTSKRKSVIEISNIKQKSDKSEDVTLEQQNIMDQNSSQTEQNVDKIVFEDNIAIKNSIQNSIQTGNLELEIKQLSHIDTKQVVDKLDEVVEAQVEINTSQDTTVTQDSAQDITQVDDYNEEIECGAEDTQTQDTETQYTQTPDTPEIQTQDTLTQSHVSGCNENISPLPLLDLPRKPQLTESEKFMCRMDTMSICVPINSSMIGTENHNSEKVEIIEEKLSMELNDVLSTPKSKASSSSIPSSPITVDTPSRTSELLNNTLDISPIHGKSSYDDGEQVHNIVPLHFNPKREELGEMDKYNIEEIIGVSPQREKCHSFVIQEEQIMTLSENQDMSAPEDILTEIEMPPQSDAVLLPSEINIETTEINSEHNLIQVNTVPQSSYQQNENFEKTEGTLLQIEETSNEVEDLHKMEEGPQQKLDSGSPTKDNSVQDVSLKLANMFSWSVNKMYMKKRVTMSPSAARIKKLMSNFNHKPTIEGVSTDMKEEDILTFSREVPSPLAVPRSSILKRKMSDISDCDGISPCAKRKRVNFSDPCLTSKKLFIKDEYQNEPEINLKVEELPELKPEEQTHDTSVLLEESPCSEKLTETEHIETEPSLEIINPLMLKKGKPIYPKLIDCKEDVIFILNRVASPMFIATLTNKLKHKEIKTIGDLAKQSEAEINRLPFKVPVVSNVYKALDNYYKKNIDKLAKDSSENVEEMQRWRINGNEEYKSHMVISKVFPKLTDLKMDLLHLIEQSKSEGQFEDLVKFVLSSAEKQEFLTLMKNYYQLEITDLLLEPDFNDALKYMMNKIGISKLLHMVTENMTNAKEESEYFDCVMKQSFEKKSLSSLWEYHTVDDIQKGLEDSINRKLFTKQDVLTQCFLPLIENPSDISSYVNRLSVVQISDVVLQRLQNEDLSEFFNKILTSSTNEYNLTLSRECLRRIESPNEVVKVFQDCITTKNEETQNKIMVEMFKYISERLNVNTLLELHIDFLKTIPPLMASSEK